MTDEINFQPTETHYFQDRLIPESSRKDSFRTTTEENESICEDNTQSDSKYSSGRWSQDEHNKFIEAMFLYGNEWKRVQQHIKTRSSTQARSHAQKFFIRLKKRLIEENLDHEITSKPLSKRNEIIMSWIQENVTSDIFNSRLNDGFYIEKRDKLCRIILNLISNPIKRKTSPKVTPARNCCALNKRNYKDCDQVGSAEVPGEQQTRSKTEEYNSMGLACEVIKRKTEDELRSDPFKLCFCESEHSGEKDYSEINNFDLDYFFGDNYKN
jgi:SHAQKYF class myb-like DNA-binding protein